MQRADLGRKIGPVRRQAARRRRRIDGLAQPVDDVCGKRDMDQRHDSPDLIEMEAEARRVLDDLRGPMRRQRHRQHAFLQIDQDQSRGAGIERQHRDFSLNWIKGMMDEKDPAPIVSNLFSRACGFRRRRRYSRRIDRFVQRAGLAL
jgi:hypothetical protein